MTPAPAGDDDFVANALEVSPTVRIAPAELQMEAITGSGPGGQHVNRSATRIALTWNAATSRALTDEQRARVMTKLGSRLDGTGAIRIVAGESRSQLQNRRAALERLRQLVAHALIVPRTRKKTKPTRGSVEARLQEKKRRSETKTQRRRDDD